MVTERAKSKQGSLASYGMGAITGGLAIYFLDTRRGAARRALVRDKTFAGLRHASIRLRKRSADLQHRLNGALYELKARLRREQVDDDILIERVRAQIGRPVAHTSMIEVSAVKGRVVLRGAVLRSEIPGLILSLSKVRGVHSIDNQLQRYDSEEEISRAAGHRMHHVAEHPAHSPTLH